MEHGWWLMRSEEEIREMKGMLEGLVDLADGGEKVRLQISALKWVLGEEMYPDSDFVI